MVLFLLSYVSYMFPRQNIQKCDKCRNHGKIQSKRAHKDVCPFKDCTCDLCTFADKRRVIMRTQQRVAR